MVSLKREGYIYDLAYFPGLLIDVNSSHYIIIKPELLHRHSRLHFKHYMRFKVPKYKIMLPSFPDVLILSFSWLQPIYFRSSGWEKKQDNLRRLKSESEKKKLVYSLIWC